MKINVNNIKVGNVLMHNDRMCCVTQTMHTQPGKGGAFLQVEMKDVVTNGKINARFRTTDTVEKLTLEQIEHQFLYMDADSIVLLDNSTFDQISLPVDLFNGQDVFLSEGMIVMVEKYENKVLSVKLPDQVEVIVEECEASIKGQTVTSSYKPAVLVGGAKISVPQFINVGDKIMVKVATREYVERVK